MTQYSFEIAHKSSGKCPGCNKTLDGLSLGSAALYSAEDDDVYGSVVWRHVACAEKRQVQSLGKNLSKIKGWDQLSTDDHDTVTEEFDDIRNAEKKVKKKAAPKGKKRKASDDDDKPKKKGKKEKKDKDKNAPKKGKNAFLIYSTEMRATYKNDHPNAKPTEITKGLGEMWKNLSSEEKKTYADKQKKDKERYERQLKEYEETGHFTPEDEGENTENSDKPQKKGRLRKVAAEEDETKANSEETENEKNSEKETAQEEGTKEETQENDSTKDEEPAKEEAETEES